MLLRLRSLQDRVRSSLFFVPMLFVIGSVVLAEAMLYLDKNVGDVPTWMTATVDSARNVLSVVAGATLSFAGIAFSVSLLLISLASSQYSPRVVHGLFRDPFNKRIMGVVIGTFTYCLVVMRTVRGPLEESGQAFAPSLSILLAVVLGIMSVLSIVAFISHSAHSMDVSKILHRVTGEALGQARKLADAEHGDDGADAPEPDDDALVVTFADDGWIQQIDHDRLLSWLAPGSTLRVETTAGRYAIAETPLATIWPAPDDVEAARRAVRDTVLVGQTRTMQQDVTYGIRQLSDVALKALSPGINDPTTAQDALFHLGAVVRELLVATPPSRRLRGDDERTLLRPQENDHAEVIGLAFDEVRIAAAGQPTVMIYLLEILHLLTASLHDLDRDAATSALRAQADLVLEIAARSDLTDHDLHRVVRGHAHRFL